MAYICENCHKGSMHGHTVSHSKRRTNRVFKPNLHSSRITIGGVTRKMKLCTKCIRMLKKATKTASSPVVATA